MTLLVGFLLVQLLQMRMVLILLGGVEPIPTSLQFKVLILYNIIIVQRWRVTGRFFGNGTAHIAFKLLFGWLFMGESLLICEEVDGVLGSLLLDHVVGMMMKLSFMCFVTAFMQLRYGFILFPLIL
jgi:hypothetical protein